LPSVRFRNNALVLRSDPTQTAFVEARFLARGAKHPDAAFYEALEWDAQVSLTAAFFIVLDARFGDLPYRLQFTQYGIHVTSGPTPALITGHEVQRSADWRSRPHQWRLERQGSAASLLADAEPLWQGDVAGPLAALALGESYVDGLHGGEMLLRSVRWQASKDAS